MDSTIQPDPAQTTDNGDIPVPVDTLAIDGTHPEVGDKVDVKVGATVSKVVNDIAWVTPETVNDQPIPADAADDTSPDDMTSLADASASAGQIGY